MKSPKRQQTNCIECRGETARPGYKYCSNSCQFKFQHREYIENWKAGKEMGLQRLGVVSVHVKRYLREKYGNRCCVCGWSKINSKSGIVPLVADHIDGNWRNNQESNLRLVCPNCDSLSPTYAALNKGNGRKDRPPSRRAEEGRMLIKKQRLPR
jgi:hypothetical protein